MSDAPYEKECTYCKNKIRMSNESGKWLPYDLNNGPHECRRNGNGKEKEKEKEKQNHSQITWEMVQKKLESIGIIINVERLMAEK